MAMALITTNGDKTSPPPPHKGGVTLIEAVLSIFIVSIMFVAVINTVGAMARSRQIQATQSSGPALGRQLMGEILQSQYVEPDEEAIFGPEASEAGNSRENFDDVDDYNNWSASPPQAKDGTDIPGLTGWQRSVTVQYAHPDNITDTVGSDQGLKRITVTVTDLRGAQTTLVALRCNNGSYDQQLQIGTHLSWVGLELRIGPDAGAKIVSGVNLLNPVSIE